MPDKSFKWVYLSRVWGIITLTFYDDADGYFKKVGLNEKIAEKICK